MKINYILDSNNVIKSWWNNPIDESLPFLEIEDPSIICLGVDKIVNGQLVQDSAKAEAEHTKATYFAEILTLKHNLAETDYQAIKFAEGELTAEEFASMKAQRHAWRARINELEALMEE